MSPREEIDLTRVRTIPVAERPTKVCIDQFAPARHLAVALRAEDDVLGQAVVARAPVRTERSCVRRSTSVSNSWPQLSQLKGA